MTLRPPAVLVDRLDAAARRWWMPRWLSDLLTQASAHIEVEAERVRLLEYRVDVAREAEGGARQKTTGGGWTP